MSHIPDGTCFNMLSIPGTHDTMAHHKIRNIFDNFAQTQSGTLLQQLLAGVRFLDIRARHYRNRFEMHHGPVYLDQNFTRVVHTLEEFLSGPGKDEVIIMRLKDEMYYPRHNKRTFAATMDDYVFKHPDTSKILQTRLYIPPDGEVQDRLPLLSSGTRGKIYILQDYSMDGVSRQYGVLFDDKNRVKIQDYYKLNTVKDIVKKKWNKIIEFWTDHVPEQKRRLKAGEDCQDLPLLINFLTGSSALLPPRKVAMDKKNGMNNRVQQFLRTSWRAIWDAAFPAVREEYPGLEGPTGVVVWDFINSRAARLIVSFNFRGIGKFDWGEVGYKADEKWIFQPWN